jgi:tRNA 2-thiouridine synthesizing protein B
MATLHLVNRPSALVDCVAAAAAGDTILCYENAVLACVAPPASAQPTRIVALRHDVEAAGIAERLQPGIRIVDDAEFVALVTQHLPIVSWG